ncbi:LysE family translocator [Tistrella sp. BH-R2-4]|uniref:LysE family translocator n=1 Tax=Tistrella arctica TaxID=3133430 RepID=A0ABU9YIW4_9PROT
MLDVPSLEFVWPVVLFATVALLSPGPNTVLLTTSGASFGFRRSLPAMAGICFGAPLLILAVGLGLGTILETIPQTRIAIEILGIAYMLWLAWKIASAEPRGLDQSVGHAEGTPVGLIQAALLQWVNPKVWTMAVATMGAYGAAANNPTIQAVIIALVFFVVCVPAAVIWTGFGVAVRRLLATRRAVRIFNWVMAVLLVASLIPIVLG